MSDALDRLHDVVAVQDEPSHVGPAGRLRIGGLILQVENEELSATARRLVADLPAGDLAAIVTDWLEEQMGRYGSRATASISGSSRVKARQKRPPSVDR